MPFNWIDEVKDKLMCSDIIRLSSAPKNTELLVTEIITKDNVLLQHGIFPGESLKILSKHSMQPFLIEVRNSLIALDNVYANDIVVQNKQNTK